MSPKNVGSGGRREEEGGSAISMRVALLEGAYKRDVKG